MLRTIILSPVFLSCMFMSSSAFPQAIGGSDSIINSINNDHGFINHDVINNSILDYPVIIELMIASCAGWKGDFYVKNQNDLLCLNFMENVEGSLIIESTDLVHLDFDNGEHLENPKRIKGNLIIKNNKRLVDLANLSHLMEVQGDVQIISNPSLNNLNGLGSLQVIGKNLTILDNWISSLFGIEKLTRILGSLTITGNSNLHYLKKMPDAGNPQEPSSGLVNLNHIGKDIIISENDSLSSLQGLEKINGVINGEVYINANDNLRSLDGLQSLQRIKGDLQIRLNNSLKDLTGLENLLHVNRLRINLNDSLKELTGLVHLTTIATDLIVENNCSLQQFSDFKDPSTIPDSHVDFADTVTSFGYLEKIGGNLIIKNNPMLQESFLNTSCQEFSGNIEVKNNPNINFNSFFFKNLWYFHG